MEKENSISEKALNFCHDMFRQNLDIDGLIPCLGKHDLLTPSDREVFLNREFTRTYKIDYLITILPHKGRDWFEMLITALKESDKGTGSAHIDLILALRREKARREQVPNVSSPDNKRQPSKIAHDTNWPTEKSNLKHLQAARSGSASPASRSPFSRSPSAMARRNQDQSLHEDIQTPEKTLLALKNHIRLLSLYESLIKHMKTFRDALFVLQSFYVEKFQSKSSQLNQTQIRVAKMIENITGCDENFELVQEIDTWNKHLESLEENYAKTKAALYSLDDSQIKRQQLQLKLTGEHKEKFSDWITGREKFVENGFACFNELTKLTDESLLIADVKIRIDTGRELLNLWRDWMNLRASL